MSTKEHWLNKERLIYYPRIILTITVLAAVVWVVLSEDMVDLKGKPLGYDFITFWAASHVALTGSAADAYNIQLLFDAEQIAVPASQSVYVWYYPPSFYLMILPLALMPYIVAYWSFMLSTLTAFILAIRRVLRSTTAMWCLAAFSGLWINLFHGQNAFLTAALAGGALLGLERRPILAGVLIGLLAIKPHLALLFPVALLAIGAWRTIITAALTGFALLWVGTAIVGPAALKGSIGSIAYARIFLENGFLPWAKMPTVFAFLRLLGVSVTWSYLVHGLFSLAAVALVWYVWRRCNSLELRGATLMIATFLVSPYVFDYDLVWLAFPLAWLALNGLRAGWMKGERELLVAAWILPMFMSPIATLVNVQIAPFVLVGLLLIPIRRIVSVG